MEVDEKIERLADIIESLATKIGDRKERTNWPIVCAFLLVAIWQQLYFGGKIEARRQSDIALKNRLDESDKVINSRLQIIESSQLQTESKIDTFLGTHVERMGPEHRWRMFKAFLPYFPSWKDTKK